MRFFIDSIHRYSGYLKFVALTNNVAENILTSIAVATCKSFSREMISHILHVIKHKYSSIILE